MKKNEKNPTLSSVTSNGPDMIEEYEIGTTELPELKKAPFFIDKSCFIQRVINDRSKVLLFTRPRRFMKTSNLRTLYYFYSKEVDDKPTAELFNDMKLKTLKDKDGRPIISTYQGRYPVVWVSFKDISGDSIERIKLRFQETISELYSDWLKPLKDKLENHEKEYFMSIIDRKEKDFLFSSLQKLTRFITKYHGQKPILLIDEYDHPISQAYINNGTPDFVENIIDFTRDLLNPVLKDNVSLQRAILTGILKISSATLLSGLNNLQSSSLLDPQEYWDVFGFTEKEVKFLMSKCKYPLLLKDIKSWYNGYRIGDQDVYNPWSIINCLRKGKLESYWSMTASVRMIQTIIKQMFNADLEKFRNIVEDTIQVELSDDFSFTNQTKDMNTIYQLLWFAGYFKPVSQITYIGAGRYQVRVKLVNQEVREYFTQISSQLLSSSLGLSQSDWVPCMKCFESEPPNVKGFVQNLEEHILVKHLSYRDGVKPKVSPGILKNRDVVSYESFYQGLMLGFFICMSANYSVISNIETGKGYSDYLLKPKSNKHKWAFIVELKRVDNSKTLNTGCQNGMKQIKQKKYHTQLKNEGYSNIKAICLCFYYKDVACLEETII